MLDRYPDRGGAFICLAFTINTQVNLHTAHMDGVLQETETTALTGGSATTKLNIGGRLTGADRQVGGIFEYFYLYARVLTDGEIASLHREPYAMFKPTLTTALMFAGIGEEEPPVGTLTPFFWFQ